MKSICSTARNKSASLSRWNLIGLCRWWHYGNGHWQQNLKNVLGSAISKQCSASNLSSISHFSKYTSHIYSAYVWQEYQQTDLKAERPCWSRSPSHVQRAHPLTDVLRSGASGPIGTRPRSLPSSPRHAEPGRFLTRKSSDLSFVAQSNGAASVLGSE